MVQINRAIRLIFAIVLAICLALIGSIVRLGNVGAKRSGTSSSVLTSKSAVTDYLKNKYSGKKNIRITAGAETKLNCNNHDQDILLNYYNSTNIGEYGERGDVESGTCWAAASTSLLEFFGVNKSKYSIYNQVIDTAIFSHYLSLNEKNNTWDSGLDFTDQDNLLDSLFSYYKLKKTANNDYYDIYKTLVSEVKNGRVVIFSIIGHNMTGCGYVSYTVKYDKSKLFGGTTTVSDTQKFVIVNDTWAENKTRQYSYFPECEIGTNIFTRWDFGITKILNK